MLRNLAFALVLLAAGVFVAPSALAADVAAGKALFEANCASCHGTTGEGNGPVGQALNPPPRNFTKGEFKFDTNGDGKTGTETDLENVIKNGAAKYGGSPLMAPWPTLSHEQVQDLIAYIHSLKK